MSKSKKEPISPTEQYAYHFENPEPKFFTQIPNIIDHLTYTIVKDGKKTTERLSIYAKELYRIIKMIASEDGKCWSKGETLALRMGCSTGKVSQAMKELLMPMDQLDGSPLIKEERRYKQMVKDNGVKFAAPLCTRTIVCVWRWNNAFMATVKFQNQYGYTDEVMNETDSCGETVGGTDSYGETASRVTVSCGEANNNLSKNIPLLKEQQPTESDDPDPVCLSKIEKAIMSLSAEQRNSFEGLIKSDFEEKAAIDLAKKYSPVEFTKAFEYFKKQKAKNKSKGNQIEDERAYFVGILKGKYWQNSKL
jgi:hypothetical protein